MEVTKMAGIESLCSDNHYAELPPSFYNKQQPESISDPKLVSVNTAVLIQLGLAKSYADSDAFLQFCSGNWLPENMQPLAMKYAGHQFGHFNPDLGDGRGLLLGQVQADASASKSLSVSQTWDIHLKGAGRTPYSRQGDGRAVLRSSIREYLCSAAMAGLNIPTTHAMSLVVGSETVWRESVEPVAMVTRIAESHVRFGHFEHFYYSQQWDELGVMLDYTIAQHFPDLRLHQSPYLAFFQQVIKTTAELMAKWQCVGFVHGVMNTDNMSILGQTFDYGPFAFQDNFDPAYVCNHTDHSGRYAYNQQPQVGRWNLMALGQSLATKIDVADLNAALAEYDDLFLAHYRQLMRAKLGLQTELAEDSELIKTTMAMLATNSSDFTWFFRQLSNFSTKDEVENSRFRDHFIDRDSFDEWAALYLLRLQQESLGDEQRKVAMDKVNPKFILRNYLAQQVIDQAEHYDYSGVNDVLKILADPFAEQPEFEAYAKLPPEWGRKMMLSCSS